MAAENFIRQVALGLTNFEIPLNVVRMCGVYQRNSASCAVACCFYGLTHGFHGVPSNLYKSIEHYDLFV